MALSDRSTDGEDDSAPYPLDYDVPDGVDRVAPLSVATWRWTTVDVNTGLTVDEAALEGSPGVADISTEQQSNYQAGF